MFAIKNFLQTGAQIEEILNHLIGLVGILLKQSGLLSSYRNVRLPALISPINIHDSLAES